MGEVHDLDAQRPHIMLVGINGDVHVLPVKLIENLISGEVALESDPILIKDILADWLTGIQEK